MINIAPLSELSLLENPLDHHEITALAADIRRVPQGFRFVRQASGVHLVFNRRRSHVTLLKAEEWPVFAELLGEPLAGHGDGR